MLFQNIIYFIQYIYVTTFTSSFPHSQFYAFTSFFSFPFFKKFSLIFPNDPSHKSFLGEEDSGEEDGRIHRQEETGHGLTLTYTSLDPNIGHLTTVLPFLSGSPDRQSRRSSPGIQELFLFNFDKNFSIIGFLHIHCLKALQSWFCEGIPK